MKRNIKISYIAEPKDKKYFKQCLKELKITKKEFACKLGVTVTMLDYMLNGERTISEDMLIRFQVLGVFFKVNYEKENH